MEYADHPKKRQQDGSLYENGIALLHEFKRGEQLFQRKAQFGIGFVLQGHGYFVAARLRTVAAHAQRNLLKAACVFGMLFAVHPNPAESEYAVRKRPQLQHIEPLTEQVKVHIPAVLFKVYPCVDYRTNACARAYKMLVHVVDMVRQEILVAHTVKVLVRVGLQQSRPYVEKGFARDRLKCKAMMQLQHAYFL